MADPTVPISRDMARLPLTYDECRTRFRRAATRAEVEVGSEELEVNGPRGQVLTIDHALVGAEQPERLLIVLSGVHGVEGFIASTLQCDLLDRLDSSGLPDGAAVLLVHAVNPWGMAWWRRQNESNVDLNRNWGRDRMDLPPANDGYDELHPLLAVEGDELPETEPLITRALQLVVERGMPWLTDAITRGQYTHPDGLHFGGDRTEASTLALERIVQPLLAHAAFAVTLDLHTGHGPYGEPVVLSDQAPGTPGDEWLRATFSDATVEATIDNPDATTGPKVGQLAHGLGELFVGDEYHSAALEIGTMPDEEQVLATYLESWVHRCGDRDVPEHAEVVWRYRCCFTPDDPEWVSAGMRHGRLALDGGVATLAG